MRWYCSKCKYLHEDNELCPHIVEELREKPELLTEAANFTLIAGEEMLVSTQSLDKVAQAINQVSGTNLSFEGSQKLARDIQVFKRLDTEAFVNKGVFHNPEEAKVYVENATSGQMKALRAKLTGSSQEIDWLRMKQGQLSRFYEKSILLNKNAVGVDGEIVNRFTGKTVDRVTVKAAQTSTNIHTNTQQIVEAIKLDRLKSNESVFAVKGTKEELIKTLDREIKHAQQIGDTEIEKRLIDAKANLRVIEKNTPKEVYDSNENLLNKIKSGNAVTEVTGKQIVEKSVQGAAIGAAVSLTMSSITSYMRYRNNEISKEEAFRDVGEDTIKGILTGGMLGIVTIFLPAGPLGFIGGVAVGIYLDATASNALDEIFGKGAYAAILDATGYIAGTATNMIGLLTEYTNQISQTSDNLKLVKEKLSETEAVIEDTQHLTENPQKKGAIMDGYNLALSEDARNNPAEALNTLIEAAKEISKTNEKDFESVKDSQWYKRLWNLVTFSKDNEIKIAKGVGNLAKLQEIVMQALILLSTECAEITETIVELEDTISKLAFNQNYIASIQATLIREIERLKTGINEELGLQDLSEEERIAFISIICKAAKLLPATTQDSREYISAILKMTGLPQEVELDYIEDLDKDKSRLLYRMLCEYTVLATGSAEHIPEEIKCSFNINIKQQNRIAENTETVFSLGGASALTGYYSMTEEVQVIDCSDLEFDMCSDSLNDESETSGIEDDEDEEFEEFDPDLIDGEYYIDSVKLVTEDCPLYVENKEVFVRSFIECSGTVFFENCLIHYNENNYNGNIAMRTGSKLIIVSSRILCHNYAEEPFINGRHSSNLSINIGASQIINAANLIAVEDGSLVFSENTCVNCSSDLIAASAYHEGTVTILQNDFIFSGRPYREKWFAMLRFSEKTEATICECRFRYVKNPSTNKLDQSLIQDSFPFYLIDDLTENHTDIVQCTFSNIDYCIENDPYINACVFENCSNLFRGNPTIEDSLFNRCTYIVDFIKSGAVRYCQFLACANRLMTFNFTCTSVDIIGSEFVNITSADTVFYSKLSKNENIRSCNISFDKCSFNGIKLLPCSNPYIRMSSLIGGQEFECLKRFFIRVSNCVFRNCATGSRDPFIEEYGKSYPMLFKKIPDVSKITLVESNNKGLGRLINIDSYIESDDYTIKKTDSTGECDIGYEEINEIPNEHTEYYTIIEDLYREHKMSIK